MDILGVGPLEILFILMIALIIFGPKDIVKAGQSTGRFLRKLMKSPGWQTVQKTSRELRNLPTKLAREAGLEEVQQDINTIASLSKPPDFRKEIQEELNKVDEGLSAWTSAPKPEKEKGETIPSPEAPTETTENN